jgi:4-hydroxy-3-polyprenylbenzoate decarboxylase
LILNIPVFLPKKRKMPYAGLADFIHTLEKEGELIRITEFVDPVLEITEVTDRFSKSRGGGKALLFENTGTPFPLLINAFGSEKRMGLALSRGTIHDIEKEMEELIRSFSVPRETVKDKIRMLPLLKEVSSWIPRRIPKKGKCQEVVLNDPDLGLLPVLQCWPADGGRFITLPAVHTRDPESGMPNVGMYRMQVFDARKTGMHWHTHKTGAHHFQKYKKAGQRMPVSVTLGGDPVYTYAATAPMPENMDEYILAGFLRKKPVRLVKCLTNDLYVPEDADMVLEGYIDPAEDLVWEGPFGDHTGFYSLPGYFPAFHITCITHRKNAVYPATIVGIPPMEDAWIGKASERIFLTPMRMAMIPELLDMELPFAGVSHNLAVVKIEKSYAGQAVKVMNSLWGAGQMMFNKILIVVDQKTNIHTYPELLNVVFGSFDPSTSLQFSRGPLDILDHASSQYAVGSKVGIDATSPWDVEKTEKKNNDSLKDPFDPSVLKEIPEIKEYNNLKNSMNIPVCIIAVSKKPDFRKETLEKTLKKYNAWSSFKLLVMVDSGVNIQDLFTVVWLATGNLDPQRDISVLALPNGIATLLADATVKTSQNDLFKRSWPNVVVSDPTTIGKIDRKWSSLHIGEFIPSPSLRFRSLLKGEGAVRNP